VPFENKGTEPLELEVTEVKFRLGQLRRPAAEVDDSTRREGLLDPMISQLGVTSDEIPLKLSVARAARKSSKS
jgi:hypothetical protein